MVAKSARKCQYSAPELSPIMTENGGYHGY